MSNEEGGRSTKVVRISNDVFDEIVGLALIEGCSVSKMINSCLRYVIEKKRQERVKQIEALTSSKGKSIYDGLE